jgi:hypothetical protein
MKRTTIRILKYLARIFSDSAGNPSAKRYACALFGFAAVVLAACGFGADIVGIFVAGSLGESIASVFDKRK